MSERTRESDATYRADRGTNVAVVFTTRKGDPLPEYWNGLPVVDGDKIDNRFDDPRYAVVGLRAKGRMRTDKHGMVKVAS